MADTPPGLTDHDWNGIRSEYERQRYGAMPAEDGYVMRNFGQASKTHFDGEGFVIQPAGGGWTWGLSLKSYGFSEHECTPNASRLSAEETIVTWDRDDTLREWMVNDARGLEHGFTVRQRPRADEDFLPWNERAFEGSIFEPRDALLTFTLSVRGTLFAEVHADGLGVQFRNEEGASVLTYSGLKVWDADGKVLPARFEPVPSGDTTLRLTVDESGARYPLTIDPFIQQAYLKASNSSTQGQFGYAVAMSGETVAVSAAYDNEAGEYAGSVYVFVRSGGVWTQQGPALKASNAGEFDFFGTSLGLSGDTLVVGASGEDSNATGVNGDMGNNGRGDSGAAYVFTRSGINWTQTAYLKASNAFEVDRFGQAVAVSGNTIVVCAPYEDSTATGVNGNQSIRGADDSGAAYVFVNNGGTWSQQAWLKASNTSAQFKFGYSAAISGDTIVIGSIDENSNATGVNGNQSDHSLPVSGAAYVFVRSGGVWSQQAYLKASNSGFSDRFGFSVSVSGDTIIVGAPGESSGVAGNQNDNSVPLSGAAYVYNRSGTVWSQQAYLKSSDPGRRNDFGSGVAVSGDTVAVGAPAEHSNVTGINGSSGNGGAPGSGAIFIFQRTGNAWTQEAFIKTSNTDANDYFAWTVAISGNSVIGGSVYEDSNSMGVNGNQSDNSNISSGAAYVFVRNTTWSQQAYLKSSNTTATNDQFGWSVAVAGETVVVGAPQESSAATGVNGAQGNINAANSGAAYVFVRNGGVWEQEAYLKASNTQSEDHFGWSVAASGNYVVIGAPEEDSAIGGVNSPNAQGNNLAANSGAAYVFARINGVWQQQAYLKASTPGPSNLDRFGWSLAADGETIVVGALDQDFGGTAGAGAAYVFVRDANGWRQQAFLKASTPGTDSFGNAVAVSGNTIVVGAEREDSGATGVNGDETDNTVLNSGAAYVFVRNGEAWTQEAYLKASNTGANDAFGWSVAVSGDTAVVSAYLEDSDATGVNHPTGQGNNNATSSGAAYIFERAGTTWSQKAYLKASNTGSSDQFGYSVTIAGDTVVVGASVEASDSTGINGAQNNNAGGSGAAYLFTRNAGAWSQQSFIKASNTGSGDSFGTSVAMTGSFLVIGAYREDSNARGVNGLQTDNSSLESGAAYVYGLESAQTALEAWRTANFGSPDNSGDGADLADPDHDGIVNLVEFATGQPPKTNLQVPEIVASSGGQLTFTYPRSKAANAELQIVVEWSDSMAAGSWTSAGTVESILSDNGVIEMVKVTIPASTSRRLFVRMRVTG